MSYTKRTYEDKILKNVRSINEKTLEDNDIKPMIDSIDNILLILDEISNLDDDIKGFWNEIASDIIASVNSATSGFYRQAIITLRSILELGCMSFFYLDHKIELHLFKEHDAKADKYVNALIRDYEFYTTKYIHSFHANINYIQTSNNSVSDYLLKLYKQLSDSVHGRFKTLTKHDTLSIGYNKELLKYFENKLKEVVSILATMYVLRKDCKADNNLIEAAEYSGTVNL